MIDTHTLTPTLPPPSPLNPQALFHTYNALETMLMRAYAREKSLQLHTCVCACVVYGVGNGREVGGGGVSLLSSAPQPASLGKKEVELRSYVFESLTFLVFIHNELSSYLTDTVDAEW